ncbi:hypothetical protein BU15DRAFT_74202 [Melanogaster broomeanus]|nr:hypothetical protein BU15DRAFT_74202 [Melanogaster broomeanus]
MSQSRYNLRSRAMDPAFGSLSAVIPSTPRTVPSVGNENKSPSVSGDERSKRREEISSTPPVSVYSESNKEITSPGLGEESSEALSGKSNASDETSTVVDGDDRPWIEVRRKTSRGKLTSAQAKAVDAAAKTLTPEEKLRIEKRAATMKIPPLRIRSNSDSTKRSPTSIEVVAEPRVSKSKTRKSSSVKKVHVRSSEQEKPIPNTPFDEVIERVVSRNSKERTKGKAKPAALDATQQIAPKSYLGKAFERIAKSSRGTSKDAVGDSPSDSEDSSSSSSSDSTPDPGNGDESLPSGSSSSDTPSSSESGKRKHRKRKGKSKQTLKPIAPHTYDGSADSAVFHRFMTEGTAYVEDGHVAQRKQTLTGGG